MSRYSNLVTKFGEEAAKKEMARVSSHIKHRPGGAFNDPEKARAAQLKSAASRKANSEKRKARTN